MNRVFEPFFTTKEQGKGTGLGLDGLRDHQAIRRRHSDLFRAGPGHDIQDLLASPQRPGRHSDAAASRVGSSGSTETILLVEDNPALRTLAERILKSNGYTVLVARTGAEALTIAAEYDDLIHLITTDVIMPGPNGRAVAEQVSQHRPGIRVLFMSGYTNDEVMRNGILDHRTPYLQKPFTPIQFARKVRRTLDAPPVPT